MTKAMLDKFLTHSIPRAILLYGESDFFISYYSQIISNKIDCNMQTMYFEEYNHQEALDYLGVNSLFGGANMLVLKLHATLSKAQMKDLFYMLEHNNNSFLIIEFYKSPSITDVDYAKRFRNMAALLESTKTLQDVFDVRFYQPTYDDMISILKNRAHVLSLNITPNLLACLLDVQNYDLSIAYNELDKFIYYENITRELIYELSYSLGDLKIEVLLNALFDKKGHLIEIAQTLYEEGIDNIGLLRELNRYFYILFKLYGHSKMYGNMDSKEALGYKAPAQIFALWSKRSIKLTTEKYLAIFDILNLWRIQQFRGEDTGIQHLIAIQQIL